jgi:hypothetical protein
MWVRWKTDRWTMSALAFMLDTAAVNATTLYGLKFGIKKPATRKFRFDMIRDLVTPHILRRLRTPGKMKAKDYLGKSDLSLHIQ